MRRCRRISRPVCHASLSLHSAVCQPEESAHERITGIWWNDAIVAAAVGFLAAGPAAAQKTQLYVYTALETDQIKAYEEGFNKAYPDIEIKWVRDSTGVITAKLLAEKANPQADVDHGRSRRPAW